MVLHIHTILALSRLKVSVMSLLRALRPILCYSERIDPDNLYHILSSKRRRMVLQYLLEHDSDQPTTVRTLVEHLEENGIERHPAYVSLYQTHLPKLDQFGMIDYNKDRGYMTLTHLGIVAITAHRRLSPILEEGE